MDATDDNSRPLKRQRKEYNNANTVCLEHTEKNVSSFAPIPPQLLLLSLPYLLIHPPTHQLHTHSLFLSLHALRRCLSLKSLDKDVECKAYTGIAELGMGIGFHEPGIENEVEQAITKALLVSQKYPSLRPYKPHLTILSARFAQYQGNHKFAHNTLRRLLTSFLLPTDPPHTTYSAYLALIDSYNYSSGYDTLSSGGLKALSATQDLHNIATSNRHFDIALLAEVIRLRLLVRQGSWDVLRDCLKQVETQNLSTSSTLITALKMHVLIIAIIFQTYAGDSASAAARLKVLHEFLDGNALKIFGPHGVIEISFPGSQPLFLQVTHPRIVLILGYLVSCITKRDPVGRKPKRRVFAVEGLAAIERYEKQELPMLKWASILDLRETSKRVQKMKADMISELVGVAIMRSEFVQAERTLANLIAHTRTCNLFSAYSALIMLHEAQLAHSLFRAERALQCYQIAAHLSRKRSRDEVLDTDDDGAEDVWLNAAARAGEVWMRLGMLRMRTDIDQDNGLEINELRALSKSLVDECDGLGGTLGAIAEVMRSCMSLEILAAKTHLKHALVLATNSQDNHLRALVLSLIASHYLQTSTEHARTMLVTAEQLAAGLGAQPRAVKQGSQDAVSEKVESHSRGKADGVGNAQLRLWIGERFLELEKRAANGKSVNYRNALNDQLREAVQNVEVCASALLGPR